MIDRSGAVRVAVHRLRLRGYSVPEREGPRTPARSKMRAESRKMLDEAGHRVIEAPKRVTGPYGELVSETTTPGLGTVREWARPPRPEKNAEVPVIFTNVLEDQASRAEGKRRWAQLVEQAKAGGGVLDRHFDTGGED